MAIRHFDVGPAKGLQRAAATDLPNLVAIAGPNGAGKSNLLEQLRIRRNEFLEPNSDFLFVGAHRTWRSGVVTEVTALGFQLGYEDVLKLDALPGFQYQAPGNLHWLGGLSRVGSSADDAQALVKTALVRIYHRQRELVTGQFLEQGNQIAPGSVPDLFAPFGELVSTLLPHLEWVGVSATNVNDVRCLFRGVEKPEPTFDIDDLSSGEKAAIALFLPFVERESKALAGELPAQHPGVGLSVVIDEPEIHLHPLLQLNVLDYMRRIATEGRAQFIFVTQSATMLDALEDDELFLLTPRELAPENQLARLSDSTERLELARTITGSTHVLTRCKPIVIIEGEPDSGPTASDQRLLRLLVPEISHWALVPMAGKAQVVRAASSMRSESVRLPGIPVFGLVDSDTDDTPLPDFVIPWPVAMVENLLLDPVAMHDALAPYAAIHNLTSAEQIDKSLRALAEKQVPYELELRMRTQLPQLHLDGRAAVRGAMAAEIQAQVEDYVSKLDEARPADVLEQVRAHVNTIRDTGRELEAFHGKRLLQAFYRLHAISASGLGWNAFLTELARRVSGSVRLENLARRAIDKIRLFFPDELADQLDSVGENPDARELSDACRRERHAWQEGAPSPVQRDHLRASIFALARDVAQRDAELAHLLFENAASIGTP